MGRIVVQDRTKVRFVAFARQYGFKNFDEALSFLLEEFERRGGHIVVTERDWRLV